MDIFCRAIKDEHGEVPLLCEHLFMNVKMERHWYQLSEVNSMT